MQLNALDQNQILWHLRRKSISEMGSQVQAGNMAGAQQTFAAVQQVDKSLGNNADASSASGSASVKVNTDLGAFMSAVQSGDLQSAQTAWSRVQANRAAPPTQSPDIDGDTDQSGFAKDLGNLLTAVAKGDASGMQAAAAAVAKDLANLQGADTTGNTQSNGQAGGQSATSGNPILNDLNSLVGAAQSGDVAGAQKAMQQLQQDLQSSGATGAASGHHHHHHHHHSQSVGTASPSASTASTLLDNATQTSVGNATSAGQASVTPAS